MMRPWPSSAYAGWATGLAGIGDAITQIYQGRRDDRDREMQDRLRESQLETMAMQRALSQSQINQTNYGIASGIRGELEGGSPITPDVLGAVPEEYRGIFPGVGGTVPLKPATASYIGATDAQRRATDVKTGLDEQFGPDLMQAEIEQKRASAALDQRTPARGMGGYGNPFQEARLNSVLLAQIDREWNDTVAKSLELQVALSNMGPEKAYQYMVDWKNTRYRERQAQAMGYMDDSETLGGVGGRDYPMFNSLFGPRRDE